MIRKKLVITSVLMLGRLFALLISNPALARSSRILSAMRTSAKPTFTPAGRLMPTFSAT